MIAGLRRGHEDVFLEVVDRYHGTLVRLAMHYIPSRAVAEDLAVAAWSRLIACVDRFDGRTSLRTWLLRTLIRDARHRCTEMARGDPSAARGRRRDRPDAWSADALDRLTSSDVRTLLHTSVAALPRDQREVIALRDVSGLSASEVCEILELTGSDLRALLHRGRTTIRNELDDYLRVEP
jgi:RNA polymerase sigma-70 factor (ECF subfamily)